jgi:hypothetical protein
MTRSLSKKGRVIVTDTDDMRAARRRRGSKNMQTTDYEKFRQWTNSKRLYTVDHEHLDGSDLPIVSKPVWTLTHYNADGSASASIATLETSPDGCSGRLTTHDLPGTVIVAITAVVSPTSVASKTFAICVEKHPPITSRSPTFTIRQARNGSIHH